MRETKLENAAIAAAEFLETVLESQLKTNQRIAAGSLSVFGFVVVFLQEVLGHGRHDGARQDVRGEHGEEDGLGQRHEEILRHAAQKEHGHEDDADGEGGDQRGHGDLRGAVEDGLLDVLAHFEIAVDVLDLDGGVVDEDADGQRQSAEGHDVDGLAERARARSATTESTAGWRRR